MTERKLRPVFEIMQASEVGDRVRFYVDDDGRFIQPVGAHDFDLGNIWAYSGLTDMQLQKYLPEHEIGRMPSWFFSYE